MLTHAPSHGIFFKDSQVQGCMICNQTPAAIEQLLVLLVDMLKGTPCKLCSRALVGSGLWAKKEKAQKWAGWQLIG